MLKLLFISTKVEAYKWPGKTHARKILAGIKLFYFSPLDCVFLPSTFLAHTIHCESIKDIELLRILAVRYQTVRIKCRVKIDERLNE
jgi:hypothetical protein